MRAMRVETDNDADKQFRVAQTPAIRYAKNHTLSVDPNISEPH